MAPLHFAAARAKAFGMRVFFFSDMESCIAWPAVLFSEFALFVVVESD